MKNTIRRWMKLAEFPIYNKWNSLANSTNFVHIFIRSTVKIRQISFLCLIYTYLMRNYLLMKLTLSSKIQSLLLMRHTTLPMYVNLQNNFLSIWTLFQERCSIWAVFVNINFNNKREDWKLMRIALRKECYQR
jgi:hypothetical protein